MRLLKTQGTLCPSCWSVILSDDVYNNITFNMQMNQSGYEPHYLKNGLLLNSDNFDVDD